MFPGPLGVVPPTLVWVWNWKYPEYPGAIIVPAKFPPISTFGPPGSDVAIVDVPMDACVGVT